METSFDTWLMNELKDRRWSMRELARRAGISHTWVADIANAEKEPSADFCIAISEALNYSREYVMRRAGILLPLPDGEGDPTLSEWWEFGHKLTPEERKEAIRYAIWRFREDQPRPLESEEDEDRRPTNPAPATST
jgi:transcriptional regulator with XRE-family HTH domain